MQNSDRWVRLIALVAIGGCLGASALSRQVVAQDTASTDQQKMDAALGGNAESDFVAKNFSLLFGAVILNQFEFVAPTGATEDSKERVLKSGSADAKVFVEGGFRYRWAWLARDSMLGEAMKQREAEDERDDLVKAARAKGTRLLPQQRRVDEGSASQVL